MGGFENLQAAILDGGIIDRDHHGAEVGKKDPVLIPITIVLMPGPGTADLGILENHLGVIVIGLVLEKLLDPIHHAMAAREHSIDAIAGMIPEGELHIVAGAVIPRGCRLVHGVVITGGFSEECDFLFGKKSPDEDIAIATIGGDLCCGKLGHS